MVGHGEASGARDAALCTVNAITAVICRCDFAEAAARLLARHSSGMNVPVHLVAPTLPQVQDVGTFLRLLVVCDGNRAQMIGELLKGQAFAPDPLSTSLEVLALGAMVVLGDEAQRARAAVWARQHVVRCLTDPSAVHTLDAIRMIQHELADGCLGGLLERLRAPSSPAPTGHSPLAFAMQLLWRALKVAHHVEDPFPELVSAPLKLTPPSLEQAMRANRDMPCACGSRKPLKQCCLGWLRDEVRQRLAAPAAPSPPLTSVVDQGPGGLPPDEVSARVRQLLEVRAFAHADSFVAELERRTEISAERCDQERFAILDRALACQRYDVVLRQVSALRTELYRNQAGVARAVVAIDARSQDAVDLLLSCAEQAARDLTGAAALSLAQTLVPIAPGLSLLLMRGLMYLPDAYRGPVVHLAARAAVAVEAIGPETLNDEPARVIARAMATARDVETVGAQLADMKTALATFATQAQEANRQKIELQRRLEDAQAEMRTRAALRPNEKLEPDERQQLKARIETLEERIREKNAENAKLRRDQNERGRAPRQVNGNVR